MTLCVPHQCHCGVSVALGLHGFVCKKAPVRPARHHALNDLVARAMASAAISVLKEPQGLSRSDGKRPDGLSLIPSQAGKLLTWDGHRCVPVGRFIRCRSSPRSGLSSRAGSRSEVRQVYNLYSGYIFQPIAMETLGPIKDCAGDFLSTMGRKISLQSGNDREASFLYQRL